MTKHAFFLYDEDVGRRTQIEYWAKINYSMSLYDFGYPLYRIIHDATLLSFAGISEELNYRKYPKHSDLLPPDGPEIIRNVYPHVIQMLSSIYGSMEKGLYELFWKKVYKNRPTMLTNGIFEGIDGVVLFVNVPTSGRVLSRMLDHYGLHRCEVIISGTDPSDIVDTVKDETGLYPVLLPDIEFGDTQKLLLRAVIDQCYSRNKS